jgi:hypothetical protein
MVDRNKMFLKTPHIFDIKNKKKKKEKIGNEQDVIDNKRYKKDDDGKDPGNSGSIEKPTLINHNYSQRFDSNSNN